MSDPTDALVPPTQPPSLISVQSAVDTIGTMLDPGSDLLWLLEKIPIVKRAIDRAEQSISGRWEDALLASDAASHLADYNEQLAQAVRDGLYTVMDTWSGEAANAADTYFSQFVRQIFTNANTMTDLSRQLSGVGEGMEGLGETIDSVLSSILDYLLGMLAGFAVGALLTFFTAGISDAVDGVETAADVYEMCSEADKLSRLCDQVAELLDDFETYRKMIADLKEVYHTKQIEDVAKALAKGQMVGGAIAGFTLLAHGGESAITAMPTYHDKAVG
ncbi:MAG: hypothetical protein FWF75_03180 [Propionibacteriaceae bacterium]|nr:hypothetical protein [Propionibacteriaceae bacterium]